MATGRHLKHPSPGGIDNHFHEARPRMQAAGLDCSHRVGGGSCRQGKVRELARWETSSEIRANPAANQGIKFSTERPG